MHPHEPSRIELARLPTPVVDLENVARLLNLDCLLMKRDDLTGLEVSGNKIRKLEYLVADAKAQGCDTLVTHGGFQSNHCRATAAVGARLGMKVRLLLRAPSDWQSGNDLANDGNLFLDRLFGADISMHPVPEYNSGKQELIANAMEHEKRIRRKPYFFPVGASVPLGCWGYIRCMSELLDQLGRLTSVDLFVPVSSSGTYCGAILGKALLELHEWRIVGIPVSDSVEFFKKDLRQLERATNDAFALGLNETDTPIDLTDGSIGEGYAIPTPQAIETLKLVAKMAGILLDPTYTAKAMAGMIDTIKRGGVRHGATPVFLHTGGAFGLMARRDLFS